MENKKLEEKAVEYEFSGENGDADAKSFIAGAKWALANQWISIEDKLPKGRGPVFTTCNGIDGHMARYDSGSKGFYDSGYNRIDVLYWMPIPELLIND